MDVDAAEATRETPVPVPVPSTPKQRRVPKETTASTPGDDSRSLRKSTVAYSRAREQERRREAEEAGRRRRPARVKEYIPLTQEQLLEEAKTTEALNKISLSELIRYEEETKKYTVNKPKYVVSHPCTRIITKFVTESYVFPRCRITGPFVRYHSTPQSSIVAWSSATITPKLFTTQSKPCTLASRIGPRSPVHPTNSRFLQI